ncbi:MAG TPA: hypothetical protein VGO83_14440 [Thermoleophilaceae bacterium]|nr:hypothetical protein [Thermoleophilaceae bacterium]
MPPASLRRVRRALFVLLFAALALASCGGGGGKEDVQDLLDKAFSTPIKSADLKLDASIQLKGSPGLDKPVRITATGPFRTNDKKLPSADIELKVGSDGGGQTITTGFLSTGDRAFVKFQDVYYEQPPSEVAKTNRSIAQNKGKRGSLKALGLDPRSWLADAKDEGEDKIAGVKTRHVSGRLDVEAVMRNLNQFVRKSGAALGGATGQAPPKPLGEADIRKIGEVVKDPTFQVYVGEEDDVIRRVAGKIEFDVPEASRAGLGGIQSGSIEFSVEFSNVNGDQQIEAPARARPLSALTQSLGGASALPGLGSGGNSQPATPSVPDNATPEAQDFKEYADCLDKARPEDTEALQRCADLLQRP